MLVVPLAADFLNDDKSNFHLFAKQHFSYRENTFLHFCPTLHKCRPLNSPRLLRSSSFNSFPKDIDGLHSTYLGDRFSSTFSSTRFVPHLPSSISSPLLFEGHWRWPLNHDFQMTFLMFGG